MGEHGAHSERSAREARMFVRALLTDLEALEKMLALGRIESGPRRVGVEQEMVLVDGRGRPAPLNAEVLADIAPTGGGTTFTTELARFNLEANLAPIDVGPHFLRALEGELDRTLTTIDAAAQRHGASVLLTGILPTLTERDLDLHNMSAEPRYRALNDALARMKGEDFRVFIQGADELDWAQANVMLEAANTSLQLHLQVGVDDFAASYNLAQLISGPLLAACVNSPMLFGRRLWRETRVAVFEHAVDPRTKADRARNRRARVSFGDRWIAGSVLDLFREDVTRFPTVLVNTTKSEALAMVERGEAPKLAALTLQNGTVWRWNRPCYGVANGIAHLRIENRILPAGPTVLDEVANAALFYGLMFGLADDAATIPTRARFEDVRQGFAAAAREGLDAQVGWLGGARANARELLRRELLPAARAGLASVGVPPEDLDRYLGTIEARVESRQTGAVWILGCIDRGVDAPTFVRAMVERCRAGTPVHLWPPCTPDPGEKAELTVADIMTRDLYTVRPDDAIDLAVSVMSWERIRHVPVEDAQGALVGMIARGALARVAAHPARATEDPVAVAEVMEPPPPLLDADTPVSHALVIMMKAKRSCIAVTDRGRLVGLCTEKDLLRALASLV